MRVMGVSTIGFDKHLKCLVDGIKTCLAVDI